MVDLLDLARQGYLISPEFLAGLGDEQDGETYVQRLKAFAFRPGDQVSLRQDLISQWIGQFSPKPQMVEYVGVLRSLRNVGDKRLEVEQVQIDAVGDILYSFAGSDLKVERTFCTYPRPFIHEYGILTLQEDRLWFVHIDDATSEAKRVFEITREPGHAANYQLAIENLQGLAQLLETEDDQAIAGEFAVEDHGQEAYGILYTSWNSAAPAAQMERARLAIADAIGVAPALL